MRKTVGWGERTKGSCSGQIISSRKSWMGGQGQGEGGWNQSHRKLRQDYGARLRGACWLRDHLSMLDLEGPGAWAHAWPGLKAQERLLRHHPPVELRKAWTDPLTLLLPHGPKNWGCLPQAATCLLPRASAAHPAPSVSHRERTDLWASCYCSHHCLPLGHCCAPCWPSPCLDSRLWLCF